jgi:hypothetical protein
VLGTDDHVKRSGATGSNYCRATTRIIKYLA